MKIRTLISKHLKYFVGSCGGFILYLVGFIIFGRFPLDPVLLDFGGFKSWYEQFGGIFHKIDFDV